MEKWFIWFTLGLSALVFLIACFQKVEDYYTSRKNQQGPSNCKPNPILSGYITSIAVGASDTTDAYCPPNMSGFSVSIPVPTTNHVTQLCYETDQNICDQSVVYQDVKFVDMTDSKTGQYKAVADRCPDGYSTPFTALLPVPQLTDTGMMPMGSNCPKMGVCVKTATGTDALSSALTVNDVRIAHSTNAAGDQTLSGDVICTTWLGQTGYSTDKVNLLGTPSCSNNEAFYICKRNK